MSNVEVSATSQTIGSGNNTAILCRDAARVDGFDVRFLADRGSSQSVYAYNSRFGGSTFSVFTVTGTNAYFHGCFFSGGSVIGTGNETCSLSTDGNFTSFTSEPKATRRPRPTGKSGLDA